MRKKDQGLLGKGPFSALLSLFGKKVEIEEKKPGLKH